MEGSALACIRSSHVAGMRAGPFLDRNLTPKQGHKSAQNHPQGNQNTKTAERSTRGQTALQWRTTERTNSTTAENHGVQLEHQPTRKPAYLSGRVCGVTITGVERFMGQGSSRILFVPKHCGDCSGTCGATLCASLPPSLLENSLHPFSVHSQNIS